MILRRQNVTSDRTRRIGNIFEKIARSKRTALLAATLATASCAPLEVAPINADAAAEENTDVKPNDARNTMQSDVSIPPISHVPNTDASADVKGDAFSTEVAQHVDAPRPTIDVPVDAVVDVRIADVPTIVDVPRSVDMPVILDVPRVTDGGADVRTDTSSSGCSSCRTQTVTPQFGYPMGNSTIAGGYSFVRPFADARIRVNCAANGTLICDRTFSAVGERTTCNDGPNAITMTYNSMGSGMQRYLISIECH